MNTKISPKDNVVTVNKNIVIDARKGNVKILTDVGYRLPTSNRVRYTAIPQWGHDANVYMNIVSTNALLMHIKDNYCIIIPKKIVTVYGQKIDVAERLKKYYFAINIGSGEITTRIGNRTYLIYRMLFALILYGDEKKKIPSQLEVHHKWMRYNNTIECMALLNKKHHRKFHEETSQASHRMGRVIRDLEDLKIFINEIKNNIEFWKNREY